MEHLPGLVIRSQAGFFTVLVEGRQPVTCHLRGKVKRIHAGGDLLVTGDRVLISLQTDEQGMIEEILPRQRAFMRLAPTPRGPYEQVLLANPDQLVLIFACAQPEPHLRMLDRFLVVAEKQQIAVFIVANKYDLVDPGRAEAIFGHYVALGYPVEYTSAVTRRGVESLRARLLGRISAFSGPSGTGKSSLMNALQSGLGLQVGSISQQTSKGRHTTAVRELFALDGGGFVADLPGIRSLALWDTEPEELDGYFPELRGLVDQCQFSDCTHHNEPGCAVKAAVQAGTVHPERYMSYLRLRFGDTANEDLGD